MNLRTSVPTILGFATTLGANAIPATGFFFAGWSFATVMVVYFLENIIRTLCTLIRIRFLGPADGIPTSIPVYIKYGNKKHAPQVYPPLTHDAAGKPITYKTQTRKEFLEGFLLFSVAFTLGAGIFLAAMIFLIFKIPVNSQSILSSMISIGAFQLVALLADLLFLRNAPVEAVELWSKQSMGRIGLLYLTVFIGVFCAAIFGGLGFLMPFILLKTLVDLGQQWEQVHKFIRART